MSKAAWKIVHGNLDYARPSRGGINVKHLRLPGETTIHIDSKRLINSKHTIRVPYCMLSVTNCTYAYRLWRLCVAYVRLAITIGQLNRLNIYLLSSTPAMQAAFAGKALATAGPTPLKNALTPSFAYSS